MSDATKKDNKDNELHLHGVLKLACPIKDGENEFKELHYDFLRVTGAEYLRALDGDPMARSAFKLTAQQAINLFAYAVAKCTPGIMVRDVLEGISIEDAMKAVQIATTFFNVTSRKGEDRITGA